MNVVSKYASLVKFSHTVFALPFAFTSYVYALTSTNTPFEWLLLIKIILCMVLARNAAMGFNRWTDREIDADNPRTQDREIPAGKISPKAALIFVVVNSVSFVLAALWINQLAFWLSPAALFIIMSYSYTKRFTAWSHIVLGVSLAIAPIGASIAVTGHISFFSMLLAATVATWTSGFDILYSMQDIDFDKAHSLHSVPARFSPKASKTISILLHLIAVYSIIMTGIVFRLNTLYWIGTGIFILVLIVEQIAYVPSRVEKVGTTFGLINGLASIPYAAFAIADLLIYPTAVIPFTT